MVTPSVKHASHHGTKMRKFVLMTNSMFTNTSTIWDADNNITDWFKSSLLNSRNK